MVERIQCHTCRSILKYLPNNFRHHLV
ncbi:hypothetical protein EXU29_16825 [Acinetobacter wuhouensis]|nr:hypothetical protein EXU29_16825 [Acinetobacter wuhouensis]